MTAISEDTNTPFDAYRERSLVAGSDDVESGGGGPALSAWFEPRETQLQQLVAPAEFENLSQFSLPAGIALAGDWGQPLAAAEKLAGISAEGIAIGPDGTPISGEATIVSGDSIIGQKVVANGSFVINGDAPAGIQSGSDEDRKELVAIFEPGVNAISLKESISEYHVNLGRLEFGSVAGEVLDANGDPVPNESVRGAGAGDVTDKNGEWKLTAPLGERFTLESLEGTASFDVTATTSTASVTFEYPAAVVEVLDADFSPVEGAPVRFGGIDFYTDESGKIRLPQVPLAEYDLVVQEYFEATVSIDAPGEEFVFTLAPEGSTVDWDPPAEGIGGVKIEVIDAETGRQIRDVAARNEQGVVSTSNDEGIIKLLASEVGETMAVQIGTGDRRYETRGVELDIPQDTMAEATLELERQEPVINF